MALETPPMSDAHAEYIRNGGCPYYQDKVWCNGKVEDHAPGAHWALFLHPSPSTKVEKVSLYNVKKAVV